jgi:hypothetical protein
MHSTPEMVVKPAAQKQALDATAPVDAVMRLAPHGVQAAWPAYAAKVPRGHGRHPSSP